MLRRSGPGPALPIAIGAVLVTALAALALLQYRWIAQLSAAEQERLKAGVEASAARFADALDRELTRASRDLQPADGLPEEELAADLAARLARWRTNAPEAKLVRDLLVVSRLGRDELALRRLDEPTGSLVPAEWGNELEPVRRIFLARGRVPLLDGEIPGLVLPVREVAQREEGGPREGPPREPEARRPLRDHVVVRVDRAWVASQLFPRVALREFGVRGELPYALRVSETVGTGAALFESGPAVADGGGPPDVAQRLFALRAFPELAAPPGARSPRRDGRAADPRAESDREPRRPDEGRWVLEVRHPAGSLDAAVAGARRRNLAVSLGVLLLVAVTVSLLAVSARRAQRLARQQMDFVAAVSHELKTPLTAMRSAGQNLAAGIVDDPEKVKRYGALVEREGRRLTEMVGRVLAFAGIRSGARTLRREPVDVRALVEAALADARWVLEERHVAVETEYAEELPPVLGDEASLRQALANLLDNALKYGGAARWIGVQARVVAGTRGEEVVLSVSDRGAGIRRGDLHRLFEPFFRGEGTGSVPGSGLGLAVVRGLVEAHGGHVTVDSAPGKGSTFSIRLPAAWGVA